VRKRLGASLVVLAGAVGACGGSAGTPVGAAGGAVGAFVIRDGLDPSGAGYSTVRAGGAGPTPLGIPGYEVAGFATTSPQVAFALNGSIGSGAAETVIKVGRVGATAPKAIWTVGDELLSPPAWNAASSELAFTLSPITGRVAGLVAPGAVPDGLWVTDADGGHRRRVVTGGVETAAWSPDGKELAFVADPGNGSATTSTLDVVPASGGDPRVVGLVGVPGYQGPGNGDEPAIWSADGKELLVGATVFVTGATPEWAVTAFPAAGGAPRRVAGGAGQLTGLAAAPSGGGFAVAVFSEPESAPTPPGNTTVTTPAGTVDIAGRQTVIEVFDAGGTTSHAAAIEPGSKVLVGWLS
jgi:dipeptidyl aminopeptidase/acylaminoacyl peptidase